MLILRLLRAAIHISGLFKNFLMDIYRTEWTSEGSVFGAVSLCFCVWNIPGIAEHNCSKFTWRTSLVPRLDEFEGQGHQGQKTTFLVLLAACVRFMFGKTPFASSFTSIFHAHFQLSRDSQNIAFSALTLVWVSRKCSRPVKNCVMRYWHGYLSGAV